MVPLFALQIDHTCDVTFLHYHFSGFFLKCCRGNFVYVIHIDSNSINFVLNSPFKKIGEFAYSNFTETCCPGLRLAHG